MKNWAMRQLLIWGALALLAAIVIPRVMPQPAPPMRSNPALALPEPAAMRAPPSQGAVADAQEFNADPQGHVYLDALVNGVPVHFLVDTGATLVTLTMSDAQAAGITPGEMNFTVRVSTANGVVAAAPVQLREIRIGQQSLYDVNALVHQNLGVSLLGQSFLTRLRSYKMHDSRLTLDWN
jgi:aspartyl protease family protein